MEPNAQLDCKVVERGNRAVDLAELDRGNMGAGVIGSAEIRGAEALCNTEDANPAPDCGGELVAGRWRAPAFGLRRFTTRGHRVRLVT